MIKIPAPHQAQPDTDTDGGLAGPGGQEVNPDKFMTSQLVMVSRV